jgi:VanZ family protein
MRLRPRTSNQTFQAIAIISSAARGEKGSDVSRFLGHHREQVRELNIRIETKVPLGQHAAADGCVILEEHPFSLGSASVYSEDERLFTWHMATVTKHPGQSMSIPSGDRQSTQFEEINSDVPRTAPVYLVLLKDPPPWLRGLAWIGVGLWAATVFWFSSRTGPQIEEMNIFQLSDKVAHFIAFFMGAPAFFCALKWSFGWTIRKTVLVCVLGLAIYGASDEYHQLYTVNRTGADVWDWTGDALGGLAGTLMCGFVYARLLRPQTSHSPAQAGD